MILHFLEVCSATALQHGIVFFAMDKKWKTWFLVNAPEIFGQTSNRGSPPTVQGQTWCFRFGQVAQTCRCFFPCFFYLAKVFSDQTTHPLEVNLFTWLEVKRNLPKRWRLNIWVGGELWCFFNQNLCRFSWWLWWCNCKQPTKFTQFSCSSVLFTVVVVSIGWWTNSLPRKWLEITISFHPFETGWLSGFFR